MNLHVSKDIQVTAALAVVCAAVALLPVPPAARLPAGLLLALFLPGYGLTRLLLSARSLMQAEFAACVLGLSLVATILGGLLLNLIPGHLGRPAWAIFLAGLTVACCAAASLRNPAEPGLSSRALLKQVARAGVTRRLTILLLSLAAVAVTGVALAISLRASTADKPSLVLWLKPLAGDQVQVGVSPGAGTSTGLALVVRSGSTQSRLAVPSLDSSRTYVETLTVPAGATEMVVDLDQGPRTLRHVQYWHTPTGNRQ